MTATAVESKKPGEKAEKPLDESDEKGRAALEQEIQKELRETDIRSEKSEGRTLRSLVKGLNHTDDPKLGSESKKPGDYLFERLHRAGNGSGSVDAKHAFDVAGAGAGCIDRVSVEERDGGKRLVFEVVASSDAARPGEKGRIEVPFSPDELKATQFDTLKQYVTHPKGDRPAGDVGTALADLARIGLLGRIEASNLALEKLNLDLADLSSAKFTDCVLSDVSLRGANLASASFTNTKCTSCDFEAVDFSGVSSGGLKLVGSGTVLHKITSSGGFDMTLENVNLSGQDVSGHEGLRTLLTEAAKITADMPEVTRETIAGLPADKRDLVVAATVALQYSFYNPTTRFADATEDADGSAQQLIQDFLVKVSKPLPTYENPFEKSSVRSLRESLRDSLAVPSASTDTPAEFAVAGRRGEIALVTFEEKKVSLTPITGSAGSRTVGERVCYANAEQAFLAIAEFRKSGKLPEPVAEPDPLPEQPVAAGTGSGAAGSDAAEPEAVDARPQEASPDPDPSGQEAPSSDGTAPDPSRPGPKPKASSGIKDIFGRAWKLAGEGVSKVQAAAGKFRRRAA